MTRSEVEALIGKPDFERRVWDYVAYSNPECYHEIYYAYLKPKPGDRFVEGTHMMFVIYEVTADGADKFVQVEGPIHTNE